MIVRDFKKVLNQRLSRTRQVLSRKTKEYAREDMLHNFKRAARRLDCSPEHALIGMREKHEVSVLDIIDDISRGVLPSPEKLEEKIGDSINYLILLEALIIERIWQQKKCKDGKPITNNS